MYRFCFGILFGIVLVLCNSCHAQNVDNIRIEETDSLIVYRPQFTSMALRVSNEIPDDEDIVYCCAGAFTAKCLTYFTHENIRCDHVCNGVRYAGSPEPVCNGLFAYYKGDGHFAMADNAALLDSAAANGGMGFGQVLILYNDSIIYEDSVAKTFWMKKSYVFRALCEKDGELCVIQSREVVPYATFVHLLASYGVKNALYLDMGGWGYARYCDNENMAVETTCPPTQYASNWIVFKK